MIVFRISVILCLGLSLAVTAGCTNRRLIRPATSNEQAFADQQDCYRLADQQYNGGAVMNPSGTMVGSAGAGAAAGVSEALAKFEIEKSCLSSRGYRIAAVTEQQAKVIDAGPSAERERVVVDLMLKP